MKKIKALLVDDLPDALHALEELLKIYCHTIEVVAKARDILTAKELVLKESPQIVFLDINMPGGSGFDFLDSFSDYRFQCIFTTAHEAHALRAIKHRPIDFLLKPIDPDELQQAVKVAEKNLVSFFNPSADKIKISSQSELTMVETKNILYFEADGRYTRVHLTNESKLVTKNLGEFEAELSQNVNFFRINRSYLINIPHVRRIVRDGSGSVEMYNGKLIEISKAKKDDFLIAYMS